MNRAEKARGALYAAVLLWVNAYLCREWLFHPTAWMQSHHGYWAAIARLSEGWFAPRWWPYWDCGIPFEFTGPPLAPAMTAAIAALRGVSALMAFQTLSAMVYCAVPVALFGFAWALTRLPEYSFFAGLLFSLLTPAEPLRLKLQAFGDETPHSLSLIFLLMFVSVLIGKRTATRGAVAAVALALAILAAPWAILSAVFMVLCLVTARQSGREETAYVAAIGVLACALVARYLPPSLWAAMAGWDITMFKVIAAAAVIWLTLAHFLPRWIEDWRIRFLILFAVPVSCAPAVSRWLSLGLRIESHVALALLVVFGARPLLERAPLVGRVVLALALLWPAGVLIVHHRKLAKDALYPADVTKTIEYSTAQRVARELPGVRVMLPGSTALWANAFTEVSQYSGSEGALTPSRLSDFGVGAVVVSGPKSFDGVLPELWSEGEMTVYRVPAGTLPLEWEGHNRFRVRTPAAPGQAISIPVSYHAGWRAAIDGRSVEVYRDGLGLMQVRPERAGPVEVEMTYNGGWELRLCGWLSAVAALFVAIIVLYK